MRRRPSPTTSSSVAHHGPRRKGGGNGFSTSRLIGRAVGPAVYELLEPRRLLDATTLELNVSVSPHVDGNLASSNDVVSSHLVPAVSVAQVEGTSVAAALSAAVAAGDFTVTDPYEQLSGVTYNVVPASELGPAYFDNHYTNADYGYAPDQWVEVITWAGPTTINYADGSGGGGLAVFPLFVTPVTNLDPCGCDGQSNAGTSQGTVTAATGAVARPGSNGAGGSATTGNPVYYATGVVDQADADLSSNGFGTGWGVSRDWTNNPGALGTAGTPVDTTDPAAQLPTTDVFGNNVVENQLARLAIDPFGSVAVATNGNDTYMFDPAPGGGFAPRVVGSGTVTLDAGSGQYVWTGAAGEVTTFYGFGSGVPAAQQGQLHTFADAYGTQTVASYDSGGALTQVARSYTAGGVTHAETYAYTYAGFASDAGSYSRVSQVQLRRDSAAVRTVQYYYASASAGTARHGNEGDLQYAVTFDGAAPAYGSYDPSAAPGAVNTDYYRYYTADAFNSGGVGGYQGGLQFVFTGSAYARLKASLGSASPDAATDAQVAPYADYNYAYDSAHRIASEAVAGAGGTAAGGADAGGLGTYAYQYAQSLNDAGVNSWQTRTVVTQPDGNAEVVYTNAFGQTMLDALDQVQAAGSPSASDPTTATDYQFDDAGNVVQIASPSAFQKAGGVWYDDANADPAAGHLSSAAGRVQTITYGSATTAAGSVSAGTAVAGDVAGYRKEVDLRQGTAGTAQPQQSWTYVANAGVTGTAYAMATQTTYGGANRADPRTTSYAYAFYVNGAAQATDQVERMTTTLPVVSAAQDGPGVADVTAAVFDPLGNLVWSRDGNGALCYLAYDVGTGAVVKEVRDVNTADAADFDATRLPAGWATPAGYGSERVTAYAVDAFGRTTVQTSPAGRVTVTTYDDAAHEVRVYDGWAGSAATGPTAVYRQDWAGGYTEALTMSAPPSVGAGGLPDGTEPIGNLQSLSRTLLNAAGQAVETDAYSNLGGISYSTAAHLGSPGTHYYATAYGYDANGNQDQVTDANGTIQQTVYNGQGQVARVLVGTAAGNLVDVQDDYYDGDPTPGGIAGGGDGNLTQVVTHPGGTAADRVTTYAYDYRDRPVLEIDGAGSAQPIVTATTYDNAGEATAARQYAGAGLPFDGNVPADSSKLRAQSTAAYDDLGRAYRQAAYAVDPATGAVGTADASNAYYDPRGQLAATVSPAGLWTKTAYDGAGRPVAVFQSQSSIAPSWAAAQTVGNDVVLSQTRTTYDGDGNAIETVTADRLPGDAPTAAGPLGGTGGPAARVSYADAYYDAAGRLTATVDVGTNGGAAWTRPAAVPAGSDTALVTSTAYDAAGNVAAVTDPKGLATAYAYDALNRTTRTVADYTDGTPTNGSNQTTAYTYDGDGHVTSLTAVMPAGQPSQVTGYAYGVTTAQGSAINDNDLLRAVQYPDPTTGLTMGPVYTQAETYTYDALGEQLTYTDRNGTTHAYAYDALGRLTADAVTAFGAGVDTAVARLGYAYDDAGRLATATSYDAFGVAVNQTSDTYDGFGQLAAEAQAVSGAVTAATPTVGYTHDAADGDRLTGIVYPNGRTVAYNYGAAGSLSSVASQITSLSDASGPIQSYAYLGLSTPVTFADGNGVGLSYVSTNGTTGDAGDAVSGLDRFGRVIDQNWSNANTPTATPVDDFQYAYDRNSNVLSRRNAVVATQSELYSYDGLDRLTTFSRGTLNTAGTAITGAPTGTESWNLDALGNWTGDTANGVTTTRTTSAQNQVKTVTTPAGGGGNATATLGYDKNGNTTQDQAGQYYHYDAWNRLVAVTVGNVNYPRAGYAYDAQGRRVTEVHAAGSTALYYGDRWQVLEEDSRPVNGNALAEGTAYQYVWSPFGAGQLVARDTLGSAYLDGSFGTGGAVTQQGTTAGGFIADAGVATLGDGTVVVAATDFAGVNDVAGDIVLLAYAASGALDTSFGTDGRVDTGIQGIATGVALAADGTLYVAFDDAGFTSLNVAAFDSGTGAAVASFGTAGVASFQATDASTAAVAATGLDGYAAWTSVESLAVDAAGDVLVAGTVPTDSDGLGDVDGSEMAVVRFASDGTADDTFGTGGLATATFAGQAHASAYALAVDPASGRVVLGGSAGPTAYGLPGDGSDPASAVAVLAADGTPDATWGSPGAGDGTGQMVGIDGGGEPSALLGAVVTALAFDADGRLLVAGVVGDATFARRYTADGYQGDFGAQGLFEWGGSTGAFTPTTVAVDAAGRVDLVGHDGPLGVTGDIAVMRLLADGRGLDPSYGRGGIADAGPADGYGNGSGSVAVTAAGDLLAVGGTTDGRGGVLLAFAPTPHPRQPVPADRLYAERDANENVTSLTDAAGVTVERYIYGSYGAVTVENPDGTTRGDGSAAGSYYGSAYLYQDMRLDVVTNTYVTPNRVYDVGLARWLQQDPAGDVNGPNRYQFVRGNPVGYADPSGLAAAAGGSGLAPSGLSVTPTGQVTVGGSLGSIGLNVPAAPAGDTLVVSGLSAGGTCGDPTSFQLAGGAATATAPAATAVAAALEAGMTSGWVHYPDNALLGYQLADPGDGGVNVAMAIVAVVAGGGPEDPVTDGIAAELLSGDAAIGVDAAENAGALENANYAQKTFGNAFSDEGAFAGKNVPDVADALRSGQLQPADVPVQYIVRDGNTLILNTRSAQALEQAGIPRSQWNAVNVTGDAAAEGRLTGQLGRNGLTSQGTPTVRPSGGN